MTTKHEQVIKDEADAEKRHQDKAVKDVLPPRVKPFDLSPLADDAPTPPSTVAVQASLMNPEVKKVFEDLIVEIRKQVVAKPGGQAPGGGGGVPGDLAAFKASVVADLNSLRDAIMLTNASLDADAGVATTTFAANGNPPPITTIA